MRQVDRPLAALVLIATILGLAGAAGAQEPYFEDVSRRLGADFIHLGGGLCGLAWIDHDNDGDLDLFVTNGPGGNALFENDGDGGFALAAGAAGASLAGAPWIGATAGDLDNDGWTDLVVLSDVAGPVAAGANAVLRNLGGAFENVADPDVLSGLPTSMMSTLLDYDLDGDLDLYIVGPGSLGLPASVGLVDGTGAPLTWDARMDSGRLLRNEGGFVFTEVTEAAGLVDRNGPCVATATDFDLDGWPDLFVGACNTITEGPVLGNCFPGAICPVCVGEDDPGPCRPAGSGGNPLAAPFNLYRNNGDGTFTDVAADPASGLADKRGYWMTATPGDIDNDGDLDFFSTSIGQNFGDDAGGLHAVLRNDGDGTFTDVTSEAGLGAAAAPWFGWGGTMLDVDNDGDLDLFYSGNFPPLVFGPTGNPGQLFLNDGEGHFSEVELGIDLSTRWTSGAAAGDFDQDGYTDLAICVETLMLPGGPPVVAEKPILLRNRGSDGPGGGGKAVGIDLVGTSSNRDGVGARVTVRSSAAPTQVREVRAGSGFLSSEPTLLMVGVGDVEKAYLVDVDWPSGFRNRFFNIRAGQLTKLPELACNFDDDGDFDDFLACTLAALDGLVAEGIVNSRRAARLLIQSIRAWNSVH